MAGRLPGAVDEGGERETLEELGRLGAEVDRTRASQDRLMRREAKELAPPGESEEHGRGGGAGPLGLTRRRALPRRNASLIATEGTTTARRRPVATARRCEGIGRAGEVPVKQRREGAKAERLVDGRRLEGVDHRHEMAEGSRCEKGQDARRAQDSDSLPGRGVLRSILEPIG